MGDTPVVATSGRIGPRRLLGQMLAAGLLTAGFTVAVGGAAGAAGATLYASPSGAGDCSSPANPCSLATALADASSGDSIFLLAGTYAGTSYTLATSVTIEPAPGVGNVVVSDDFDDVTVFTVGEGVTATLVGLDLTTGNEGMGILNEGTLTVEDCNIYDNFGGDGGGIENLADGVLSVVDSAIYDNVAGSGGGIFNNEGIMDVQDSTIAGNDSSTGGGGIVNNVGTSTIESSTIFGNSAEYGGGIDNLSGTITLAATIVAGAPYGGDCLGTVTDAGYNVFDDVTCGGGTPQGGQFPTSVFDSTAIDDYLGTLGSYGGPTQTVPLLPSPSAPTALPDPALGVIPGTFDLPDGTAACSGADQRGIGRQAPCDTGAFELAETDVALSPSVPTLAPGGSVTYTATISPVPDGGTVAFSDGGGPATTGCPTQPVIAGVAHCTVTYPHAGPYSVVADYSGDTDFASSNAGPLEEIVGTAETTTTAISFSTDSVDYGQENFVRFTVAVHPSISGVLPRGSAIVYAGGTPLCTVTFSSLASLGSCTLTATALPAGLHTDIYATYVPGLVSSSNPLYYFTGSSSLAGVLDVLKDATTTVLVESPVSVNYGAEAKAILTVTVKTAFSVVPPNGEQATVHIGPVTCTVTFSGGTGSCNLGNSELPDCVYKSTGRYPVFATYGGDTNLTASSSPTIYLTIISSLKAPPCT